MTEQPLVMEIKGNSQDDGPGIRSVVFFKGCPLDCVWCHNPESKAPGQELSFDGDACVDCGECLKACPRGALSRENPFYVDRDLCDLCGECVEQCPSGALSLVAEAMEAEEIAAKILKDKPFYEMSGGGVTLSGGEPTLFMDFLSALLKKLKQEGVHTLLETCGLFSFDRFETLILPHVDQIYMDIKFADPDLHARHCGVRNEKILENFTRLAALSQNGGPGILPRTPLIPGLTDDPENLSAIADFLKSRNVTRAGLLAYNPLWLDKTRKIGVTSELQSDGKMRQWMDRDQVSRCEAVFRDRGIKVV